MSDYYVPKFCPDCGKRLFDYHVNCEVSLKVWCKHCHVVKTVKLLPSDTVNNSEKTKS